MSNEMRLVDAAEIYGGTLLNPDCRFSRVSIDSRKTVESDLFVALKGPNFDAHEFLPDVANRVAGLVVSKANTKISLPQWVVADTTQALGQIAKMRRDLHTGLVIAITGSSGKTSVKEMTATILRQQKTVHATMGNLNNHIGVPLTLLAMAAKTDIAVLEMGASAASEIGYLCEIARPDIALVNNVQRAHLEGFGSVAGIAAAKGEIYSGLSDTGTAIVNIDQPWIQQWQQLIANRPCITFSVKDQSADFSADNIEAIGNGCYRFDLYDRRHGNQSSQSVDLSVPGLHSISNALAAASCASAAGADLNQIALGLAVAEPVAGRLSSTQLSNNLTLINDTYNANPDSFKAGIDVLSATVGRSILVMGDMAELGDRALALHQQIGEYALQTGIDAMYCVGDMSRAAAEIFGGKHFKSQQKLIVALKEALQIANQRQQKMTVLVKGSRSSGMDKVVEILSGEGVL